MPEHALSKTIVDSTTVTHSESEDPLTGRLFLFSSYVSGSNPPNTKIQRHRQGNIVGRPLQTKFCPLALKSATMLEMSACFVDYSGEVDW